MAVLFNRVRQNTATLGTITVVLGAAFSDAFFTFDEAGAQNGDVVTYEIEQGNDVEMGRGTYTTSGATLSRDTVLKSKIAGVVGTTKLTLAGAAVVRIVALAEDVDITKFPSEASPAVADELYIRDASAASSDRMTFADFMKIINGLTAETAPAIDDQLALYDTSAGTADKIALDAMLKVVNGLTEDTAPDPTNDFQLTYDASAAAAKKVALRRSGGLVYLDSGVISSAATLDLVLTSYTAYKALEIHLTNLIPATDDVNFWCRLSTNGGSSYDAAAGNYMWVYRGFITASADTSSSSDTEIELMASTTGTTKVGNGAAEGLSCVVRLTDPANAAIKTRVHAVGGYYAALDRPAVFQTLGYRITAQDTDAIRFLFSSGNIASGQWALYGNA